MAKPKSQRVYRGMGNKDNRLKRDVKRFTRMEREGKPAGFKGGALE